MREIVEDLVSANRSLDASWQETEELWRDSVRRRFAREFSEPIDASTRSTLAALDEMAMLLQRIEREMP